jgi:hypothetical protein
LCKQEIVKTRQEYSSWWSIGGGLGGAVFTFGASLAVSAYGGRRLYVATKKLELIKAELTKRGISLHEFQKRDALIPAVAGLVGAGIGFGVDMVALGVTNAIPMGVHVPTGSSAMHEVLNNPGDALQGIAAGAQEQGKEILLAGQGLEHGIIPGSDLSTSMLASHTVWCAAPDLSEAIGFHQGMMLAQGVEKSTAAFLGSQCTWSVMEGIFSVQMAKQKLSCSRSSVTMADCDQCGAEVRKGTFWRKSY